MLNRKDDSLLVLEQIEVVLCFLVKKQIFHINTHANKSIQRERCCPGHVYREKPVGAAGGRQREDEST